MKRCERLCRLIVSRWQQQVDRTERTVDVTFDSGPAIEEIDRRLMLFMLLSTPVLLLQTQGDLTRSITVDAQGEVAAAYAYSPWGVVVGRRGAVENPFTFVGTCGVMDEGDGLFFMANRYYDARLGRFIQRDPIGLAGGWNQYAYAGNNPIGRIDPMGYFGIDLGDWKFWVGSTAMGLGTILMTAPTGVTQVLGAYTFKTGVGLAVAGGALDAYSMATAMPDKMVERAQRVVGEANMRWLKRDEKTQRWVIDPESRELFDDRNLKKLQASADRMNAAEEQAAKKKKQWFCVFW